jgi:hypothetical protein
MSTRSFLTLCILGLTTFAWSVPSVHAQECDYVRIAQTPDPALTSAVLQVGSRAYSYEEIRIARKQTYEDVEKDIALRVLNLETCTTQVITVKKAYVSPVTQKRVTTYQAVVVAPPGWDVRVVRRANGIQWNAWATEYKIVSPANMTVIGVVYPTIENPGAKNQTVTMVTYAPHGVDTRTPEVTAAGLDYLETVASRAYHDLRRQGVMSKAFPQKLVADVVPFSPDHQVRLALIEHLDMTEFILDPTWTLQRLLTVVGLNQATTAANTCSKASACGLMQFTSGTYKTVRQGYPAATLNKDFVAGAQDHLNSMKAALLLHDLNLASLMKAFGPSIATDKHLEEYLAAAYNTGVSRVINVVRASRKQKSSDWAQARGVQGLLAETKGYITKLRYIVAKRPSQISRLP